MGLFGKLFGANTSAPPDAAKLDGTTEATLGRSLSALPQDGRGWVTFAEARTLFSAKADQYAFGETDDDGKRNIESFAAQYGSVCNCRCSTPAAQAISIRYLSDCTNCKSAP